MKLHFTYIVFLLIQASCMAQQTHTIHPVLAVHGGASNIKSLNLTPDQQAEYTRTLSEALDSGYAVLKAGGKASEAVVSAIKVLEDSPLFNAGRGSVLTSDTTVSMDAAIMGGKLLKCGAISGVSHVKNPIMLARKIMENSPYVFLSGAGAEQYAREQGLTMVEMDYFITDFRRKQLLKSKATDSIQLDNEKNQLKDSSKSEINPVDETDFEKFGTVGCVALDMHGNLAAGTSTGGIVNKKYDRIGDSPVIGAGTYANNLTCAVSCTGKGEDFIRLVAAYDISARMEYLKEPLDSAVNRVILKKLKDKGGRGGCIAIDAKANIHMAYTTSGMFRGFIDKSGKKTVKIFE